MKEWINVKDRLPQQKHNRPPVGTRSDVVLIAVHTVDGDQYVSIGYFVENPTGTVWIDEATKWIDDGVGDFISVTHWMPLPEPPKGVIACG